MEIAGEDKEMTESENQMLLEEQEFLKKQLEDYQNELDELRSQLEKAKSNSANEQNKKFRSALRQSEKIVWEKETLAKQLDLLRSINKRLQDEKDEIVNSCVLKETESIENIFLLTSGDVYKPSSYRQNRGSVLSDYFPETIFRQTEKLGDDDCFSPSTIAAKDAPKLALTNPFLVDCIEGPCEDNEVLEMEDSQNGNPFLKMIEDIEVGEDTINTYRNYRDPDLDALNSFHEDGRQILNTPAQDDGKAPTLCLVHPNNHHQNDFSTSSSVNIDSVSPEKMISNNNNNNTTTNNVLEKSDTLPTMDSNRIASRNASCKQSVFKVIFIGDSGVGKTSLINRICGGYFDNKFCTTIGVDFRVKTVVVDGHDVVLQLWDTAGQERFRSITSQYMRRSDGVLIVYDVNSEPSFRNVNSWLSTMESVNADGVLVALVGNKVDLCSQYGTKVIATSDGMLSAADIDALFFETSAKDYLGVEDLILTLARKLRKKQLEDLEDSVRLSSGSDLLKIPTKKNSCC